MLASTVQTIVTLPWQGAAFVKGQLLISRGGISKLALEKN